MSFFSRFPDALCLEFLSLLTLVDITRSDSSLCNHDSRKAFLQLLCDPHFVISGEQVPHDLTHFFWVAVRAVKIDHVRFCAERNKSKHIDLLSLEIDVSQIQFFTIDIIDNNDCGFLALHLSPSLRAVNC
jgi:hypothetical protein